MSINPINLENNSEIEVMGGETKQVRTVLWTRKAPACLLTLVYAYGKPRLPPVHKYSSQRSTAHRAAAASRPVRWTLRYTQCAGSIVVKVQCQV